MLFRIWHNAWWDAMALRQRLAPEPARERLDEAPARGHDLAQTLA